MGGGQGAVEESAVPNPPKRQIMRIVQQSVQSAKAYYRVLWRERAYNKLEQLVCADIARPYSTCAGQGNCAMVRSPTPPG